MQSAPIRSTFIKLPFVVKAFVLSIVEWRFDRFYCTCGSKIVCEYDQEIPQSQTADKSMAPRGRATQQSRDTKKTN